MYLGDNLITDSITGAGREFRATGVDALILLTKWTTRAVRRRGAGQRAAFTRLVEKPKEPKSTWRWSASTCSGR